MYEYEMKRKTWRAVDGDTIDCDIDLGFKITHRIRGRLAGVDTPERGDAKFKEATEALECLMLAAEKKEGPLIVQTKKTGKFGRWIIHLPDGINERMAEHWPYKK